MTRGEVWWVEHPTIGRRPACILTRAEAVPVIANLLVVPATRTIRKIATEVPLGPADGMPEECVLSVDNIQPVPKGMLIERVARLRAARMEELCRALAVATGCG